MDIVTSSMPRELHDLISTQLQHDERIVWSGQPKPVLFHGPTLNFFLFGIPWTIFSIGMIGGFSWPPFADGVTIDTAVLGVPFLLLGCLLLSLPLWSYRKAQNTGYVVTDQRAITIDRIWKKPTIRIYWPEDLKDVFRRERRDGTGDIIIKREAWRDSDGHHKTQELGFFRIANAKAVEMELATLAQHPQVPPPADA